MNKLKEIQKPRVIVVDDEEGIREILVEILIEMDCYVKEVANGKEAFNEYINSPHQYDLIISDMQMPLLDGLGLVREIRKLEGIKQPKIILATGGSHSGLDLVDAYIYKPFSAKQIIETVEKCLSLNQNLVA